MVDAEAAVKWFDDWGLTPETANQVLKNYSEFLCRMTGGKLSKIGYSVSYMEATADDFWNLNCDECWYRKQVEEKDGATVSNPAS
jgi:hypothetical protein